MNHFELVSDYFLNFVMPLHNVQRLEDMLLQKIVAVVVIEQLDLLKFVIAVVVLETYQSIDRNFV